MRNWMVVVLCVLLLISPQHTPNVAGEESVTIREIKQFTVYNLPKNESSIVVVDGHFDDISVVDENENKPFTIKLVENQRNSSFKVGWRVEAICYRYEETDTEETANYFNCDLATTEKIQKETRLEGVLYSQDIKTGLYVIEADQIYYRVEFKEEIDDETFDVGDQLLVKGVSQVNRPLLISDASYKILESTENNRTLIPCEISSGGWNDGLFRVKTHSEFWQVNFHEEQPNKHLKKYMQFGIRGVHDNHLEQTLHNCILLDILEKRIFTGTIIEILPAHGLVQIVNTNERNKWINVEMSTSELMEFKADDSIKIAGIEICTRYDLPLLFTKMISISGDDVQPVDFSAEIENCESCDEDRIITVISGNNRWEISAPDEYNCETYDIGDWISIKGSIQSFKGRIIQAKEINKSKAIFLGSVTVADYSRTELMISSIQNFKSWIVRPNSSGRNNFRRGEYFQVRADLVKDKPRHLTNATLKKLKHTKGQIISIDAYEQQLTIRNIVNREMIIDIRPDWYNINHFYVGDWIDIFGVRAKRGLKDTIITTIAKED